MSAFEWDRRLCESVFIEARMRQLSCTRMLVRHQLHHAVAYRKIHACGVVRIVSLLIVCLAHPALSFTPGMAIANQPIKSQLSDVASGNRNSMSSHALDHARVGIVAQ